MLEDFKISSQELVEMGEEYKTAMGFVAMMEEGGKDLALADD